MENEYKYSEITMSSLLWKSRCWSDFSGGCLPPWFSCLGLWWVGICSVHEVRKGEGGRSCSSSLMSGLTCRKAIWKVTTSTLVSSTSSWIFNGISHLYFCSLIPCNDLCLKVNCQFSSVLCTALRIRAKTPMLVLCYLWPTEMTPWWTFIGMPPLSLQPQSFDLTILYACLILNICYHVHWTSGETC